MALFGRIKGFFKIKGATDGTLIGNDSDSLNTKVTGGAITPNFQVQHFPRDNEFAADIFEPAKLQRYGGAWVSLSDHEFGAPVVIGPNGVLQAEAVVRLVGDNFVTGEPLLSHLWNTTLTNGGTITTTDGELSLNTNTTADGEVSVETFRRAPFITATFNFTHLAIAMPNNGNADVIREWGAFDPDSGFLNGVSFRNDSGSISVRRLKNGVLDESVAEGSFNGSESFTQDDNIHIYEIWYNAGTIIFTQDRKVLHRMAAPTSAAYGTPHLKIGAFIQNINGNTVANSLVSRGLSISRLGSSSAIPKFFHIAASGTFVIKNTPGSLERIIIGDVGTGASQLDVYNHPSAASGEIITSIDTNDVSGVIDTGSTEFDQGLVIDVAGGMTDITVIYV